MKINIGKYINTIRRLNISTDEILQNSIKEKDSIKNTIAKINMLNHDISKNLEEIQHLRLFSNEVNSFVKIIYRIIEQSDLLALNISIGAMNIGESRGEFEMVSDEIRKLVVNSQNMAKDIEKKLEDILSKSEYAVDKLENNREYVTNLTRKIVNAKSIFDKIMNLLNKVVNLVDKFYLESNENPLRDLDENPTELNQSLEVITTSIKNIDFAMLDVNNSINRLVEVLNLF